MLLATVDQDGFLLILVLRYSIFVCYFLNGLLWLRKNPQYALNRTMFLASASFGCENLSYAIIDTLAYLIRPFPLAEMNLFRDFYGIFLGSTFVFFYLSTEIIEKSWEGIIQQKGRLVLLFVGYGVFLALFLPNDAILADGNVSFQTLGYIAWLVVIILFFLIYRRLFRVMRSVQEKRHQAIVFLLAISMLLIGFLYFVVINIAFAAPPYVALHGDNFLYITIGILFVVTNRKKTTVK